MTERRRKDTEESISQDPNTFIGRCFTVKLPDPWKGEIVIGGACDEAVRPHVRIKRRKLESAAEGEQSALAVHVHQTRRELKKENKFFELIALWRVEACKREGYILDYSFNSNGTEYRQRRLMVAKNGIVYHVEVGSWKPRFPDDEPLLAAILDSFTFPGEPKGGSIDYAEQLAGEPGAGQPPFPPAFPEKELPSKPVSVAEIEKDIKAGQARSVVASTERPAEKTPAPPAAHAPPAERVDLQDRLQALEKRGKKGELPPDDEGPADGTIQEKLRRL